MKLAYQMILYIAAALLVAFALVSADLAAVAFHKLGGRGGGAMAVIFLELALAYAVIAASLVARARGYLRRQLTVDRLHLLGTATGFTLALPLSILAGVASPAVIALLAFLLGFMPSAFYALPEVSGQAEAAGEAA